MTTYRVTVTNAETGETCVVIVETMGSVTAQGAALGRMFRERGWHSSWASAATETRGIND